MIPETIIITKLTTDALLINMILSFSDKSKEEKKKLLEEDYNKQIEWLKRNFEIKQIGDLK